MGKAPANYITMNSRARRRRNELRGVDARKQLERVYLRDCGVCQLCKMPCSRTDATRDHIKPFHLCTRDEARNDNNIQLAHVWCNQGRDNKVPDILKDVRLPPDLTQNIGTLYPELIKLLEENDG